MPRNPNSGEADSLADIPGSLDRPKMSVTTRGDRSSWYKNYFKRSTSESTPVDPTQDTTEDEPQKEVASYGGLKTEEMEITVVTNGDSEDYILIDNLTEGGEPSEVHEAENGKVLLHCMRLLCFPSNRLLLTSY